MKRRDAITAMVALLALPHAGTAQTRMPVVGFLSPIAAPKGEELERFRAFVRLRELGWIEGKTVHIEPGFSNGEHRLAEVAKTLVDKHVDVIWAIGPEAALAAARLTSSIPIVFWGVGYPVEQGLVQSLGRPGRNITGVTWFSGIGVYQKMLELVQQIVPGARRVGWIQTPSALATISGDQVNAYAQVEAAAKALTIELMLLPVHRDQDFDAVFQEMLRARPDALCVGGTMLTLRNRARILEFANSHRIPSVYSDRSWVELGGLVSYGANNVVEYLRAAEYVDRILRGAKPADLPVLLPSVYEIVLNLKTAKLIGVNVAPSVLVRAERVIQ
jgi:putative ABC transport system substrate-binding protein